MIDRAVIDAAKKDRALLVSALADAGGTVKGSAVKCPDPNHGDRSASGSIFRTDDGSWLYRCHAAGCDVAKAVDAFGLVQHLRRCSFSEAAEHLGVNGAGSKAAPRAKDPRPSGPVPGALAAAEREGKAAADRLASDPAALDHLWRTRGIDVATAKRFGLGIIDDHGRSFWTMQIRDPQGEFIGLKLHRADDQKPKSKWRPTGVSRDNAWPVDLEPSGPIWVCSGELKALTVISIGRPAIGITSGEDANLPDTAIELLRGWPVALVPDDDAPGEKWRDRILKQLGDAGITSRVVDLGLDSAADLNDIADFIVRERIEKGREPGTIAATLDGKYEQADPWWKYTLEAIWDDPDTWEPVTHIPTGLTRLDKSMNGGFRTSAAHVVGGKSGRAKTQTVVQIMVNVARSGTPACIFSLEMDRQEMGRLVMAQVAEVPRSLLDKGELEFSDIDKVQEARKERARMPLLILDDDRWVGGLDREKFARLVAEGVERFGWRIVVLDYLGLLAACESDRSDFQTDLLNSTELRRIARKHDIALIVIASLRKAANFRGASDAAPTLNDIAGAGRIVYDATTVHIVDAEKAPSETGSPLTGLVKLFPLKARFNASPDDDLGLSFRWYPSIGRVCDLDDGPPTGSPGDYS